MLRNDMALLHQQTIFLENGHVLGLIFFMVANTDLKNLKDVGG